MSSILLDEWDVVVTDPLTGRATGLAATSRRVFKALNAADVPYCVIGAAALAARGLPRMTRDLDIVVLSDDADVAIRALHDAKLRSGLPAGATDESDAMMIYSPILKRPWRSICCWPRVIRKRRRFQMHRARNFSVRPRAWRNWKTCFCFICTQTNFGISAILNELSTRGAPICSNRARTF